MLQRSRRRVTPKEVPPPTSTREMLGPGGPTKACRKKPDKRTPERAKTKSTSGVAKTPFEDESIYFLG